MKFKKQKKRRRKIQMKRENLEAVERERERGILLEDKETSLFNSLTHTHTHVALGAI